MALAAAQGLASIAFPAISTGVYGFPADRAAAIAVREMRAGLARHRAIDRAIACCFDEETAAIYRVLIEKA